MNLSESLVEVWRQAMAEGRPDVEVGGERFPVGRTRHQGLRTVFFRYGDFRISGIEQNPETTSRWARLAREGQRIMQFSYRRRYVANVCEGRLMRYGSWKDEGLPD